MKGMENKRMNIVMNSLDIEKKVMLKEKYKLK
jgi:hypothetical protein